MDHFKNLKLRRGKGGDYKNGLCVMEAVAWMASEGATDKPKCACRVLGAFAIRLNDQLDSENRQELKRLILPMTGTRSPAHEKARAEYIVMRVGREIVPQAFDSCELREHAQALRSADNMQDLESAAYAASYAADAAADAAVAATDSAYAAASYAARSASYAADAAADAAVAATYSAYAADCASSLGGDRQSIILQCIPILEGAIDLGPNARDQWPDYAPRMEALTKFVEKELAGAK